METCGGIPTRKNQTRTDNTRRTIIWGFRRSAFLATPYPFRSPRLRYKLRANVSKKVRLIMGPKTFGMSEQLNGRMHQYQIPYAFHDSSHTKYNIHHMTPLCIQHFMLTDVSANFERSHVYHVPHAAYHVAMNYDSWSGCNGCMDM